MELILDKESIFSFVVVGLFVGTVFLVWKLLKEKELRKRYYNDRRD